MARYRGRYSFRGDELRSGLELRIAQDLQERGVNYEYEKWSYEWYKKVRNGVCQDCAGTQVLQQHWYTPDFFLPNNIIIEAKGHLTADNRNAITAVRTTDSSLDLRLVFMANNKIGKNSLTRYSDWAEKNNIKYAFKLVPEEWVNE